MFRAIRNIIAEDNGGFQDSEPVPVPAYLQTVSYVQAQVKNTQAPYVKSIENQSYNVMPNVMPSVIQMSPPAPPQLRTPTVDDRLLPVKAGAQVKTHSHQLPVSHQPVHAFRDGNALAAALAESMAVMPAQSTPLMPHLPYPLLEGVLKDGAAGLSAALDNTKDPIIKTNPGSAEQSNRYFAARSLYLETTPLDAFNFCSDLAETTPPPYKLECLAHEWVKMGGQPAALKESTIGMWNAIPTWGLVRQRMAVLVAEAQPKAEPNVTRMPPITGVETYWFNRTNNTFLGRIVTYTPPKIDAAGIIPIANPADIYQLVMIGDLRPVKPMTVSLGAVGENGGAAATLQKRGVSGDVPEGVPSQKDCWSLAPKTPNVVVADWLMEAGSARFDLFYRECDNKGKCGVKKEIPTGVFRLAQEPDAPFLDFHYRDGALVERRLASVFEVRTTGGAEADDVRGAVRLRRNGALTLLTPIAADAWETTTVRFVCYELPVGRQAFFTYGSMFRMFAEGGRDGGKAVVKFTGANLTRTVEWPVDWVRGETYVLYMNMRSSFEGAYPDIFNVAVLKEGDVLRGLEPAVQVLRTGGGEPLYNMTDSHVLMLGSVDGLSADFGIEHIRFFDYELKGADLKRDVENNWLRIM